MTILDRSRWQALDLAPEERSRWLDQLAARVTRAGRRSPGPSGQGGAD